uniref:Uncharacterized protein n=1 Tax=Avena sativa TaxID=4498 RepID=A0ACD5Z8C8_AVESA
MGDCLMSKETASNRYSVKTSSKKGRRNVKLEDLPEDVLRTVLSKLPVKEVLKTSALSSQWRYMWTICPRLSFDSVGVCGGDRCDEKRREQNFVDNVNLVLQKYRGKEVEKLEVRFAFDGTLVDHLTDWVSYAVSSRTKNIAFDLAPVRWGGRDDRYIFPLELFDSESISRLQCIQLSFVSLKLPTHFRGFQNLRKLDLNLLHVTRKDLENMLSNCDCLEWLSIVRCHLYDELRVESPLSHLMYLRVVNCIVTKVQFHAPRLSTFEYKGHFVPIIFPHCLKMETANIFFFKAVFQHALGALLSDIPSIQNLTLRILPQRIETQWDLGYQHKLSQLRNVQLLVHIFEEDVDNVLYLVSFLKAAPFIEKLEVHFGGCKELWFASKGPARHQLPHPRREYSHLKDIHITGYKGARGQLEFLLHMVEHAPALEALTVHTTQLIPEACFPDAVAPSSFHDAGRHARDHLRKGLSPKVKFCVV